jgi:hypothetical protein
MFSAAWAYPETRNRSSPSIGVRSSPQGVISEAQAFTLRRHAGGVHCLAGLPRAWRSASRTCSRCPAPGNTKVPDVRPSGCELITAHDIDWRYDRSSGANSLAQIVRQSAVRLHGCSSSAWSSPQKVTHPCLGSARGRRDQASQAAHMMAAGQRCRGWISAHLRACRRREWFCRQ